VRSLIGVTDEIGKTTIVSRIIDDLKSRAASLTIPIVYFYFGQEAETGTRMDDLLRAILVQLLYQDDTLVDHFFPLLCSTSASELKFKLKSLVEEALKTQRRCIIVLDGLDACGVGENQNRDGPKEIIQWFKNTVIPISRTEGGIIQLLVAGQRDGILDQCLAPKLAINLDSAKNHLSDIARYVSSITSEISERFSLSIDEQRNLTERVTNASKGKIIFSTSAASYYIRS